MKLKHQVQFGTESGIVSSKAVKHLRMLITDVARTVQNLDASVDTSADEPEFTQLLAARRRNLMVTIATLEDHLWSVVKMQSRYAAKSTHPHAHGAQPH